MIHFEIMFSIIQVLYDKMAITRLSRTCNSLFDMLSIFFRISYCFLGYISIFTPLIFNVFFFFFFLVLVIQE